MGELRVRHGLPDVARDVRKPRRGLRRFVRLLHGGEIHLLGPPGAAPVLRPLVVAEGREGVLRCVQAPALRASEAGGERGVKSEETDVRAE